MSIAGLDYIRAEGYVFSHVADEGLMNACAGPLLRYRKHIGADNVKIFTDIKKKHRYVFEIKWIFVTFPAIDSTMLQFLIVKFVVLDEKCIETLSCFIVLFTKRKNFCVFFLHPMAIKHIQKGVIHNPIALRKGQNSLELWLF